MPPPSDGSPTSALASHLLKRSFEAPETYQIHTVIAACVMVFLGGVFWNIPILRDVIAGLKLLVVATHEFWHIVAGLVCGGSIVSVCIDPNEGGATHIMGIMRTKPRVPHYPHETGHTYGQLHWSVKSVFTLWMGYFGSSVVGFLYIFAAFDIVASKIASFTIAFAMLVPLVRADTVIPFLSVFAMEMILIGMWFGDHGSALRFYVLWVGVLNLFYPVWDYVDERLFDKPNTSDCTQFADMSGQPSSLWFTAWTLYDCLVFVAALFAGMIVFHKSSEKLYQDAAAFLPT